MTPAKFAVGRAAVISFDVGDLSLNLGEVFGELPSLTEFFAEAELSAPASFPTKSFYVESGATRVVVDPSDYPRLVSPDHFRAPERYSPPPSLLDQLASSGVDPAKVTHVVVTHLHFDHYAGVTRSLGGGQRLSFPEARYAVPKKDWEMPDIAEAREKKDRDLVDTLEVAVDAGRLDLVDGPLELGDGVSVEPYPGESPGHQVVGVKSDGASCYFVGDLYHLTQEVEHPQLVAAWADGPSLVESRRKFSARAAAEEALVLPGHLSAGRISLAGGRASWTEAA